MLFNGIFPKRERSPLARSAVCAALTRLLTRSLAAVSALLFLLAGGVGLDSVRAAAATPAYLLFQVFSYNPDPRAAAAGISNKSPSEIARTIDDILSLTGGERGDHR